MGLRNVGYVERATALHVGLKSLAPSGCLRNISNYYFSTVKLDIVTKSFSYCSGFPL
ncbi:hypothetical protein Barb7_01750 [Bacteroidales bacterium Barb7]|nr:hypothetical protein Barb7_01750 [Bacteroidales bacterium Barb7]